MGLFCREALYTQDCNSWSKIWSVPATQRLCSAKWLILVECSPCLSTLPAKIMLMSFRCFSFELPDLLLLISKTRGQTCFLNSNQNLLTTLDFLSTQAWNSLFSFPVICFLGYVSHKLLFQGCFLYKISFWEQVLRCTVNRLTGAPELQS